MEWLQEGEDASRYDEDDKDVSKRKDGVEAEDGKKTKKGKANQATTETLTTITENCDNVLEFLQAVAVN